MPQSRRIARLAALAALAAGLAASAAAAWAQVSLPPPPQVPTQYCAEYTDGTYACGIPTWEECERTISGVGGQCQIDTQGPPRESVLQKLLLRDRTRAVPDIDPPPPPPDE
ncbi:MAG: hypothetical protein HXY30_19780 [Pseudorhodoplanes sp.]|nr:hypothetical protein [Pseudorhodoplanes sp.]